MMWTTFINIFLRTIGAYLLLLLLTRLIGRKLISQGQMVEENMKKCRVTINELMMLLREKKRI